jgi:alpha-amylase
MCTKVFDDGGVHAYFSPYDSPFDAFLYYMNTLRDVHLRVDEKLGRNDGQLPKPKVTSIENR